MKIKTIIKSTDSKLELQRKEAPSLWDRTYTFVSDHYLAIAVGVTIGAIALGMLSCNATLSSQTPFIQKEVSPLSLPSSLTSSPTTGPPLTPIPTSPFIPSTCPSEKFTYSDWLQEETTHQSGNPNSPITLFTSYTKDQPERVDLSRMVAANHQNYCEQQQYHHLVFERNLAEGALPYWSKIAGLKGMVEAPENVGKKWFAWLDDDMVITNRKLKIESFIDRLSENDHIIVTEDAVSRINPNIPLNTGFMLVRNSDKSRHILNAIWDMRYETLRDGITYANCPNQNCLHEQQALTDLLKKRPDLSHFVRIISQRFWDGIGINTFSRLTHYDMSRQIVLSYRDDPIDSQWIKGDFMAQCTGLATSGRTFIPGTKYCIPWTANLRKNCVEQLIYHSSNAFEKINLLLSSFFRDI